LRDRGVTSELYRNVEEETKKILKFLHLTHVLVLVSAIVESNWYKNSHGLCLFGLYLCLGMISCAYQQVALIDDPSGDDFGPGSYRYPEHPSFSPGSFDLHKWSLAKSADDWIIEVEFKTKVKTTPVFLGRDQRRELFSQTIDVYFSWTDEQQVMREKQSVASTLTPQEAIETSTPLPPAGEGSYDTSVTFGVRAGLPGRNIAFAEQDGWQKAVVITSVPHLVQEMLAKTTEVGNQVYVPLRAKVVGKKIRVKVPKSFLGQAVPKKVAVLVLGTRYSGSFQVIDRVRGTLASDGLVMPVVKSSGECRLDDQSGMGCAFSGCQPCGAHPHVIDLLDPLGDQLEILNVYDVEQNKSAIIPLVPVSSLLK
jgi:hypothetical protein